MSISTTKQMLAGSVLLAISSSAKSADSVGIAAGGKSQLGVNHLSLNETPGRELEVCTNGLDKFFGSNVATNNLTVIVQPLLTSSMELVFTVSDVLAEKEDHILFLVYSTGLSPTPMILTPNSIKKLEIDMTYNEIAAMYDVPKQSMLAQDDTRIGRASPSPASKVSFKVNLSTNKILDLIRNGQSTIYVQAALLSKADFNAGKFNNMILSEADTITFVDAATGCSGNGIKILEKDGQMTISDGNSVLGLTISPAGETKFFITDDIGKILSFIGLTKERVLSWFGLGGWL